jgi:hypothetical protein
MIRDSLIPALRHLEYKEWERAGHYPWLEREVHKDFYAVLVSWLLSERSTTRFDARPNGR